MEWIMEEAPRKLIPALNHKALRDFNYYSDNSLKSSACMASKSQFLSRTTQKNNVNGLTENAYTQLGFCSFWTQSHCNLYPPPFFCFFFLFKNLTSYTVLNMVGLNMANWSKLYEHRHCVLQTTAYVLVYCGKIIKWYHN